MIQTQWAGKKVAFLGDSITDKVHVGTEKNYWQFLEESLGIEPLVYGLNGWQWSGIIPQAENLEKEHGHDVDAIIVFMGTNDYNSGIMPGCWYVYQEETVNSHGTVRNLQRRIRSTASDTLRGRINNGMHYLKSRFPLQQIILLTPIHRGYAEFGGANIQPEESFPNDIGLYFEEYIGIIKEAGGVWSVPVIDLYSLSGLLPVNDSYAQFFHDSVTDRLHPNAAGHARIARTLQYQLMTLPATFR